MARLVFCFLLLVSMASAVPYWPHRAHPHRNLDFENDSFWGKREAKHDSGAPNGLHDKKALYPPGWEYM
uniref:CLAVATA3/ESR-like protein n=1 Tax=Steinernema glaseri TaxID=37863 RepID=A0A1I7ZSU6_9BILA